MLTEKELAEFVIEWIPIDAGTAPVVQMEPDQLRELIRAYRAHAAMISNTKQDVRDGRISPGYFESLAKEKP